MISVLVGMIIQVFSSAALAAELLYTCVVRHVYDVDEAGRIRISNFESILAGGKFTVSRQSGSVIGDALSTAMAKRTWVVNYGGTEQAFKAASDFNGQIQVIEIQEFRSEAIKPFVAMSMGGAGIVTGTCK